MSDAAHTDDDSTGGGDVERPRAAEESSRPLPDLLVFTVGLASVGGYALSLALFTQLTGPVVTEGVSPQTQTSLVYGSVGIGLLLLATAVYRQHPIGWYGAVWTAVAALFLQLRDGFAAGWFDLAIASVPIVVLFYLFGRRDAFAP